MASGSEMSSRLESSSSSMAWRTSGRSSRSSTTWALGKPMALVGQEVDQVMQPTMQFIGSATTAFLRLKSNL